MNHDIKEQLMEMLLDKYIFKFEAECARSDYNDQHQIDELEKVLENDFGVCEYDLSAVRHNASYIVFEGLMYETV